MVNTHENRERELKRVRELAGQRHDSSSSSISSSDLDSDSSQSVSVEIVPPKKEESFAKEDVTYCKEMGQDRNTHPKKGGKNKNKKDAKVSNYYVFVI